MIALRRNKLKDRALAEERINENSPKIIKELFKFPYLWVGARKLTGSFLDVGCGVENYGREFLSSQSVDIARDLKTSYIRADAKNLPFSNESFDNIVCFEVLEHLEEQEKVIKEFVRIAKNTIIIGSINKDGPDFIEGVEIYKGKKNPFHLKELGIKEFKQLFGRFKDKKFYHSNYSKLSRRFVMAQGLNRFGYSNYCVIKVG